MGRDGVKRQRALLRFRLVPLAVAVLAESRIDARPLLARLDLADAPRTEPLFLPLGKVCSFLDGCARLAGDPFFGWNLAPRGPSGMYGLIEFTVRTGTLRDALTNLCRFGALVNGLWSWELDERRDAIGFGST
jgi:hypothetical protein